MLSTIIFHFFTGLALLGRGEPLSELDNQTSNSRRSKIKPIALLADVLHKNPELSKYTGLVSKYPAILNDIADYAGVTLLAPTDIAFARYPSINFDNADEIVPLLQYHILQEQFWTDDWAPGWLQFPRTLLFNQSYTNSTGGQRVIAVRPDEDEIVFTSGFDSRALVVDSLRDIGFFDGTIQPIDSVLVLPPSLADLTSDSMQSLYAFLGALHKAGLADRVLDAQNVTFFVPTTQAFQRVFGAMSELSQDDFRNLVNYHIVPDNILFSTDLTDAGNIVYKTAAVASDQAQNPLTLSVTLAGNDRYIDSSRILDPDILVANGVVHVISDVLNPKRTDARPKPEKKYQDAAFDPKGSTATGTKVPTPYLTDLPFTTDTTTSATPSPTRAHGRHHNAAAGNSRSVGGLMVAGLLAMGAAL